MFGAISDGFSLIFSRDWTAIAFMIVFMLGLLLLAVSSIPSVRSVVFGSLRLAKSIEKSNKQQARDVERVARIRKSENGEKYAQMLLKDKLFEKDLFVTIEGKRYYRKGIVSHGRRMNDSDKDFSLDLDMIDNE